MGDQLISLLTLVLLELVLGIDNVVLISILVEKLPTPQRPKARNIGLALAMIFRVILLFFAVHLSKLTTEVISLFGASLSWRDLILLLGGMFLLAKATTEIFNFVEGKHEQQKKSGAAKFQHVVMQILVFDLIFSLDSVLTAVGLTDNLSVMVVAVVLAMGLMLVAARPISSFVMANPGIKMLALSFLILIGTLLVAEAFDAHVNRSLVYFAMGFSLVIELLNKRQRSKARKANPEI